MIKIFLTDLVKDLRQGSSSFFTLKSSWSVPCGNRRFRHSSVDETFFSAISNSTPEHEFANV
jgi:hypothetical protein